jgi:DNA-binding MarR family transcriptional regulator
MTADEDAFEFIRLISGVNRQLERSLETRLKPEGVSIEHFRVLDALARRNGQPMSELARHVLVDGPTLTKIVDRVIATSDVYRAADPGDRRKVLVFLSAKGRKRFETLRGLLSEPPEAIKSLGREKSLKLRTLLRSVASDV